MMGGGSSLFLFAFVFVFVSVFFVGGHLKAETLPKFLIDGDNDPQKVPGRDRELVLSWGELPDQGKSHDVWTGDWYPYEGGGTAKRTHPDQLSPLEKYDKATNGKNLATQWELQQAKTFKNIPWAGHCNGLAAAGTMTKRPRKKVFFSGVEFTPQDIKALLVESFQGGGEIVGGRCERFAFSYDEFGRLKPKDCLDVNPGTFHLIVANFVGLMRLPVIIDGNGGEIVWNVPVVQYQVTGKEELERASALERLGLSGHFSYPFNPRARQWTAVRMKVTFATGVTRVYEYLLEKDEKDHIIGGEWLGESQKDHPDFLWRHTRPKPHNPFVDYGVVEKIHQLSL